MNNRFDFLGVSVSRINLKQAVEKIRRHHFGSPSYICFPDASVVSEASRDAVLKDILNNAWLTMPDGKPSQLAARLQGYKEVCTVSGFHLCHELLETELTHYFYGGDEHTLNKMMEKIKTAHPRAKILGCASPPFVSKEALQTDPVIQSQMAAIQELNPQLIWIGISSPKQDILMHHYHRLFPQSIFLGVGGVFLYLSNDGLRSPEWMKKIGLRWLYRLSKEPKRLRKKYYNTFTFLLRHTGSFIRYSLQQNSKP